MLRSFLKDYDIIYYCGAHGSELVPMNPLKKKENDGQSSDFYACPRYFTKDRDHPDGHSQKEVMCLNNLSFLDAGDILASLTRMHEQNIRSFHIPSSYVGHEFQSKHYLCRVVRWDLDPEKKNRKICIMVINKKRIARGGLSI